LVVANYLVLPYKLVIDPKLSASYAALGKWFTRISTLPAFAEQWGGQISKCKVAVPKAAVAFEEFKKETYITKVS
jgi:hypothetical protein